MKGILPKVDDLFGRDRCKWCGRCDTIGDAKDGLAVCGFCFIRRLRDGETVGCRRDDPKDAVFAMRRQNKSVFKR